jgi:hypothetical protein
MIHGYTYHFIHTPSMVDRAPFWTKIPALADTLSSDRCRITVSIDADATFMNLNLPFEWLLNRWNITTSTSLAMVGEPIADYNNDAAHGRTNLNAGFVIAQDLPRTQEILKAWAGCPENDAKYPNCSRWRWNWPAEQAAFSEYIRYEFNGTNDIKTIDCNDANGYPASHTECQGTFLRHHWGGKERIKDAVAESVLTGVMGRIRGELIAKLGDVKVERVDNEFHG